MLQVRALVAQTRSRNPRPTGERDKAQQCDYQSPAEPTLMTQPRVKNRSFHQLVEEPILREVTHDEGETAEKETRHVASQRETHVGRLEALPRDVAKVCE